MNQQFEDLMRELNNTAFRPHSCRFGLPALGGAACPDAAVRNVVKISAMVDHGPIPSATEG